jgi:hypothetical protein
VPVARRPSLFAKLPLTRHLSRVLSSVMPASNADPAERLRLRPMLLWTAFAALLVLGIVLWFRFSGRIVPMLDSLTDR